MEHLRRLAVVFAVPIRLKIVTELYQREMSPKQFQEEFGGGSVSRIAQHFERLRETGWLRQMWTEGPGGKRRGGVETIYRATELAFCDRPTWAALPHSIKVAFSWNTFKEIAEQFRGALEAATLQARPDRRLTGTRLLLDQKGWTRVADAVSQEFAAQFEEQEDARRRVGRTGEELFRMGSLLLAFELPISEGFQFGPVLVAGDEQMIPFPVRVSKVFEDEVCMQIMDEANRGDVSVPTFYAKYGKRFGLSKNLIRRRFQKLVQYGWLKVVDSKTGGKRRGATEYFYRATGPALYDEDKRGPWAKVPDALAETEDWGVFERLSKWVKAAMVAGTIVRHDETCLAWVILQLDQKGWERVLASLKKLHAFVVREQELAEARLMKSGGEPISMVVALGAFETPEPIKEP
ncbi:MAG TPA: winged helix-turn-helix domain-containing protein [Solirubrobacterales bacterium]|nr:winged helix-turn-helix domain-containing protein [Solirubrobacterales bacterium]